MATEFKLPELGENIETIQVAKILVSEGDTIEEDQPLFELETDKATIEVPSTVSGTVQKILVSEGDEAEVGQTMLTVNGDAEESGASTDKEQADETDESGTKEKEKKPEPDTSEAKEEEPAEKPKPEAGKQAAPEAQDKPEDKPEPKEEPPSAEEAAKEAPAEDREERKHGRDAGGEVLETAEPEPAPAAPRSAESKGGPTPYHVPAAPSVRKFAREIGVDIDQVKGSGPRGRVSIDDVKRFAKQRSEAPSAQRTPAAAAPELPDFEQFGNVERKKMSVIRRKTAEHMSLGWSQAPHVTIFDDADITELDALRKKFKDRAETQGGKLTMAVMVCKAAAAALKIHPKFNASIDMAKRELVLKKYVNLGVAVSTDRGLVVPVLRDADKKNMVTLAVEISQIAAKARDGKLELSDMEGGTFTVTNLGRICGTYFTPIINYPEVAILGIGRAGPRPIARDGDVQIRTMLPLSLSFDHRIIDGAEGAEFLRWIIDAIEQPLLLSLEG